MSASTLQVTFGEYFDRWWAARQVAATRLHTDRQRADRHLQPHWKHWRLADIRPSDVDDWVASLSRWMVRTRCATVIF